MGQKPHTPEIKRIALHLKNKMGYDLKEINKHLDLTISERSLREWSTFYRVTKSFLNDPDTYKPTGRHLKLPSNQIEFVMELIEADPATYLDGMQEAMCIASGDWPSTETLYSTLERLGIKCNTGKGLTRKVVAIKPAPSQSKNEVLRAQYGPRISHYPTEFICFGGEMEISEQMLGRKVGRASEGRPELLQKLSKSTSRSKGYSVFSVVSASTGLVHLLAKEGSISSARFLRFCENELVSIS